MNIKDTFRQITFTVGDVLINVVENADALDFTVTSLGGDDLRGLFFDFNQLDRIGILDSLELAGLNINNSAIEDEGVDNLKQGVNLEGTGLLFDIGIAFGTAGSGTDIIQQTKFTLSSTTNALTLDDIANVEFGVRTTSEGDKLTAIAPAAPDAINDSITTNEDTATDESTSPNGNLLANDTDADGDPLTIVAINNGNNSVGTQFVLTTGGLATVNSDGTFDLDPNGAYEDLAVGEIRTDSFTYKITDELLDPNNQGFDTATANITFTGLNDAPIISVASGDSSAETVIETNSPLTTNGTLTVSDVDTSDFVTSSVMSVSTSGKDDDASTPNNAALLGMLTIAPINILDDTEQTDTLNWSFGSNGEAFDYLADDEDLELTYTVKALDDNGASDTQTVTITVDGTNDQPIAQNVAASVGEDDPSVTGSFVATDVDTTDVLSYEILGLPMDANGHQYGSVINNIDGTFTFLPGDQFQFLDANESRDVTFQYQAIDDSGVTATNTSAEKTVTITVNGAFDAPIEIDTPVLFESVDQSMWETGPATIINYRDFFGVSWDESFDKTLVDAKTITIVPEVDLRVAGVGPYYGGLKASTPEVGIEGGTTGRFGISPYFEFNSGDVDSSIPVDVDLTYEVQYEDGDNVSIATGYTLDNAAYFDTESPSITFGLDLVFEATANGSLSIGSSNYNLFPNININVDEAEPIPGVAGSGDGSTANLLEFSSITGINSDVFDTPAFEEDGEYTIPIFDDSSLVLSFPYIETEGAPVNNSRLDSTGSDDLAVLTLDVDDLLSQTKYFPQVSFSGDEGLPHLVVDLPGFVNTTLGIGDVDVDLFSVNWDVEFFDLDLIGTLTAVQDFILDIDELPLLLTLENGFEIDGYSLGDTIDFVVPDLDLDNIGDMDGELDYTLDIDMEAIFNNWTTLDFSLDLFAGILKATGGWTSDIVGDQSFNLFGDASDPFLYSDTFNLLNVSPLATLFGDEDPAVSGFDLEGWNTPTYIDEFNIA